MTLHDTSTIDTFAISAAELRTNWNSKPPQLGPYWRRDQIKSVITAEPSFMVTPTVFFEDSPDGSNGFFSWGGWILRLRKQPTETDQLLYADYVTFCRTIYHEIRHAEQFYRVAQGLAAGVLKFPQKSGNQTAQAMMAASGASDVASKIAMFGQGRKQHLGGGQIALNGTVIAQWLSIPENVANTASGAANQFAVFTGGPKPAWFKRSSVLLETEDWMRATYSGSLSAANAWAQTGESRKMYRDQPEEHDAHEIGNAIVAAIDQWSGRNSNVPNY